MKTYIVQLENHDDIISVQDKISWSKANRVLLVWPRRGRVLERRVDLLLLLRHSQKIGTQLALATNSAEVKSQAQELGIPVFKNAEQAQRAAWRQSWTQRKLNAPEDRQTRDSQALRRQRESFNGAKTAPAWLRVSLFILGVGAFLTLVLFFIPGAQVTLKPERQSQTLELSVWANPEIKTPNPSGGLPAKTMNVVVEGRDQVNSTGIAVMPDGYAAGEIQMKNLTDQAVDVPEGSIVISLDQPPTRFVVTQPAQVPAGPGQTTLAAVRAEAAGSGGNLAAGKIQAMEGTLGLSLAVENPEAMHGGTDRVSPAPTDGDYDHLRAQLLEKLKKNALTELNGKITSGQRLLVDTLNQGTVIEETREPAQGQPGDRLQLSMRVEFEIWAVDAVDVQAVAQAALGANRPANFQPVPQSLKVAFIDEPRLEKAASGEGSAPASARWQIHAEQALEASWVNADLVNALRGCTLSEASRILQSRLALAEPPTIVLYPSFWKRMPYLPARIMLIKQ